MDAIIFRCVCCDHMARGTEEQAELFNCRKCQHDEWEKAGILIEHEMFFYVESGELVHIDKLTRAQKVAVGLKVPASHA
jgi:hypothetical protein